MDNKKKRVLIACPTYRDKRELGRHDVGKFYELFFQSYKSDFLKQFLYCANASHDKGFDPALMLQQMYALCHSNAIGAITSTDDYPGNILASIMCKKLGYTGPEVEHILLFQHKYHARCVQQHYVPEATPWFMVIDRKKSIVESLTYPIFMKPVKASFSFGAHTVSSKEEFEVLCRKSDLSEHFLRPFQWFVNTYSPPHADHVHDLLIEQCLYGVQVTLEGFVYNNTVHILGITDSIMYPGTISFKAFQYPSMLPSHVQERMHTITQKLLHGVGYNNAFFNIEFMYNPATDDIFIIEVNPRMASQFADFYEKVDGLNSYEQLLALACGKEPPLAHKGSGPYNVARCFVLRVFSDKKVLRVPTQQELEAVYAQFPDARIDIFVCAGQRLSEVFQDGKSYRYALVHLGGRDEQDLVERYAACMRMLPFVLVDC